MNKQLKTALIATCIAFFIFVLFLYSAVPDDEWPPRNFKESSIYLILILGVPAFIGALAYYFSSIANRDKIASQERATTLSNLDKSYIQTIDQSSQNLKIITKNEAKKMIVPLFFVAGFFTYFIQLVLKKYISIDSLTIALIFIVIYTLVFTFYVIKYQEIYEVNTHDFKISINYWFIPFNKAYQLSKISNFKRVIVDHMQNGVYAYSDRNIHFDYDGKKKEIKTSVNNEGYSLLTESIEKSTRK